MRNRQLGMSPAKIAIAVAVTIEAIAGTGGMKKVTGTSRAVAIVAVRPGTAPTNRPNMAEPRTTQSTYGSSTIFNASKSIALEQSPRQRNAQEFVEREMDDDRRDDGDRQREAPRRAQDPHPDDLDRERGEIETEPVGGEDVEQQPGDDGRDPRDCSRASDPVGESNQ